MKIATWNVNSIRAREDRVVAFLEREHPDVVCLQELKVEEKDFPFERLQEAGYHAAVLGQRTYNGVAILSRAELTAVTKGMGDDVDDPAARLIDGTVDGIRIASAYFPNGQTVGSDKYEYKLEWMSRLLHWLDRTATPDDQIILCGDFNVAPEDRDVARPEEWAGSVLCHQQARDALERLRQWGLVDVFRRHNEDGGLYSWWDYRMLAFPKGNGLRIDHIYASRPVAARSTGARIDRNERKGKKPSDHVPVIAEFAG
jgi:exodeoxyribonuclease III